MDLTGERSQKITPRHLRHHAYLYVRQSTLRQVVETPRVPSANTRSDSNRGHATSIAVRAPTTAPRQPKPQRHASGSLPPRRHPVAE
jgi:hypothetical protein